MSKAKKIISPFEWDMLVGAWRYHEHRATIASATFPANLIARYFRGDYEEEECKRIARQFVKVDHERNGEGDWRGDDDCDRKEWCRLYAFLKAYLDGFEDMDGLECFYCETMGLHYLRKKYVDYPSREWWVDPKDSRKANAEKEGAE